jgi:hypothetical protein
MATVLSAAALASPVCAQQSNATATAVSSKTVRSDADDEQNRPNAYQLFGYGDPKLDSLSRQVDHYSKLMYNYDHSKAYETLIARAKGFSTKAPGYYANDTLRRIMTSLDNISKDLRITMNRDLAMRKDSLGRLVGDYFKTQKFTKTNSKLQEKYHIDPAKSYTANDAGYHKYHEELLKKMPEEIKNDIQQLKDLSETHRNRLHSPEYVTDIKQLHILLDSMKSFIKTQHTEQYTYASYEATMDVPAAERRQAQEELRAYLKRPEFHDNSEKLNEYGKEMRDYYKNSPAVKEHEEAWKNELRTILAGDYDVILHPGRGLEHLYNN